MLAFASAFALALATTSPLEAARHARGGTGASADPTPTPAERAYVAAVDTMRALQSPPYATYDSLWKSTGLGFDFEEDDGRIEIDVGVGRSFVKQRTFAASYRAADRALQLTSDAGQRLIGRGRLLEPTWAGAYELLRYGLHGESLTATTAESVVASPAPSDEPAPNAEPTQTAEPLPNIATVSAIAPLYYRVYDAGSKPCSSGGPTGRALHLVARTNVRDHPLTDVVLDPETGRFCSLTFVVKDAGLAGITGHYTIEFAPFGTCWLVSHGVIDIDVRVFGIAAKHATLTWTIAGLATPDTLPESSFERDAVPLPSPAATLAPVTSPQPAR
jgi:hypothetical protein